MGDPIRVSDSERKRLLDFLTTEHTAAERNVLTPLQDQRDEWDDLYYGRVKPRRQSWMSNFPILMGATFVDAVSARLMNTLTAYRPTWALEPTRNAAWSDVARGVERYMDYKARVEMKLYREMRKAIFETCRGGFSGLFTPWVTQERQVYVRHWFWNRKISVPVVNGVVTKHISARDLLYPGGYNELEDLTWWARRLRWPKTAPKDSRYQAKYANLDQISPQPMDPKTLDAHERGGEQLGLEERIINWESFIEFDLKKKGDFQKYLVTWNPEKEEILRTEEDTYLHWPLQIFRYGPRDVGLHGLGVMQMTAPYDNALYALYNLLVDNFNIATMSTFKGRKGRGLRSDTPVYPGKIFLMDNPAEDLLPMAMGAAYQLDPSFPRLVWDLGERRAGISDYALGRESPIVGSKATATGTLALIQEGQRRFDLIIRDIREAMDALGMFVLEHMHMFLSRTEPYMVMGEDGRLVEAFLSLPGSSPYLNLNIISNFSNVIMNKEVRKQDMLATTRMLAEYYKEMIQLMMLAAQSPPEMKEMLMKMAIASSRKMKGLLEAHGEMSADTYTDVFPEGGERGRVPTPLEGGAPGTLEQPGMEGY